MTSSVWQTMTLFARCQIVAPLLYLPVPNFRRALKVDSCKEIAPSWSNTTMMWQQVTKSVFLPHRLQLRVLGDDGTNFRGTVDLETATLHGSAQHALFRGRFEAPGSTSTGDLGVLVIGLPGIFVTLPFIVIVNVTRIICEKWLHEDLDVWFLWRQLRQQIPEHCRPSVLEALRKAKRELWVIRATRAE